jgi:hypothetical protein
MGQRVQPASRGELPRREAMQTPEETLSDMLNSGRQEGTSGRPAPIWRRMASRWRSTATSTASSG